MATTCVILSEGRSPESKGGAAGSARADADAHSDDGAKSEGEATNAHDSPPSGALLAGGWFGRRGADALRDGGDVVVKALRHLVRGSHDRRENVRLERRL